MQGHQRDTTIEEEVARGGGGGMEAFGLITTVIVDSLASVSVCSLIVSPDLHIVPLSSSGADQLERGKAASACVSFQNSMFFSQSMC